MVEEVICRFGVPSRLLTDQGRNLTSEVMKEVCRLLGIRKLQTTAYHPQCDGMVERFNRTLQNMLSGYVSNSQDDWDRILPYVCFAYRSSMHESTGETPFFLNFGRDPALPLDIGLRAGSVAATNTEDFRHQLTEKLNEAWSMVERNVSTAQAGQKKVHDKRANTMPFVEGDRVYMHVPVVAQGKTTKLARLWKGPYRITSMTPDGLGATLAPCQKSTKEVNKRVNVRRLKKATTDISVPPLTTSNANCSGSDSDNDDVNEDNGVQVSTTHPVTAQEPEQVADAGTGQVSQQEITTNTGDCSHLRAPQRKPKKRTAIGVSQQRVLRPRRTARAPQRLGMAQVNELSQVCMMLSRGSSEETVWHKLEQDSDEDNNIRCKSDYRKGQASSTIEAIETKFNSTLEELLSLSRNKQPSGDQQQSLFCLSLSLKLQFSELVSMLYDKEDHYHRSHPSGSNVQNDLVDDCGTSAVEVHRGQKPPKTHPQTLADKGPGTSAEVVKQAASGTSSHGTRFKVHLRKPAASEGPTPKVKAVTPLKLAALSGSQTTIVVEDDHPFSPSYNTQIVLGCVTFPSAARCFQYYRRYEGNEIVETMYMASYHKFAQNPCLMDMLQNTQGSVILFHSPNPLWGTGLASQEHDLGNGSNYPGENQLGIILMDLRQKLSQAGRNTELMVRVSTEMPSYGEYQVYPDDTQVRYRATVSTTIVGKHPTYNPHLVQIRITLVHGHPSITVKIGSWVVLAMVDTGATTSAIQSSWMQFALRIFPANTTSNRRGYVITVGEQAIRIQGTQTVTLFIGNKRCKHEFAVITHIAPFPILLGHDFLSHHKCTVDLVRSRVIMSCSG